MSHDPLIRRLQVLALGVVLALAIVAGLLIALLITADIASADDAAPQEPAGAVCPPGNVKYEVDGGYEYTDDSAAVIVTADRLTATWAPAHGYAITGVCIKIGGPGGGELVHPAPSAEFWTSATYAISHVVLTTRTVPNAVVVTDLRAARVQVASVRAGPSTDVRWLILFIVATALVGLGADVWRHYRRP